MAHGSFTSCCQYRLATLLCLLFLTTFSVVKVLGAVSQAPPPPARSPPPSPSRPRPPPPGKAKPPSISPLNAKPSPPRRRVPRLSPSPKTWRPRGGIRLMGSNITGRGWLEMLIGEEWTPVCSTALRSKMSQLLCQLLGFRYGQPYLGRQRLYDPQYSDYKQIVEPQTLADCDVKDSPSGKAVARVGEYNCWFETSSEFPYLCSWLTGFSAVVELQCSGGKMPPVPPSPPPPPPPPIRAVANYIRLVSLEANFDDTEDYSAVLLDNHSYRVELMVNTSSNGSSGSSAWAPLCAPEDSNLNIKVLTDTTCSQAYANIAGQFTFPVPGVRKPILIPTGSVPTGGFDPAKYTHWVTVVGGVEGGLNSVQQMNLKVTTTPCSTHYLFSLACALATV